MSERHRRGLLDTSVVVDLASLSEDVLPAEFAISTVTLAELTAGPAATDDPAERARRQDRLQRTEATFDAVPFGVEAARAYGLVHAAVLASGRQPRGRLADLLIAATAAAEGVPVYTRNASDFTGLDGVVDVVVV